MRRSYLDTSALRHLLVVHHRSADVAARLLDTDTVAATSQLAVTELHRMALREPQLTLDDVDAVLGSLDLVAVTGQQLRAAGLLPDLPSGVQLRSLDAIHIQSAVDFGATEFLTSDGRQAAAAAAAGLFVQLMEASG